MNGVINIISKHASETQGLLVSGRAGNIESGAGAVRYGHELAEGALAYASPADYWQLVGTYALIDTHLDRTSPDALVDAEAVETRTPKQQIGVRSNVNHPGNLEVDANLYRIDHTKDEHGCIDAYTRLDTRLARKPRDGIDLAIVGLSLIEEHQEIANGTLTTPSEIPRPFYGAVRWEFK